MNMDMIEYGDREAPIVLVQPIGEQDAGSIENEIAMIREGTDRAFHMLAFRVRDWNRDLSPWPAPAVFGREGFAGNAPDTLSEILRTCTDREKTWYIGGYSLAGLFALWAAYRTDLFRGVAAASPSLWYPGIVEYMKAHDIGSEQVYLSLGDREEKTRNPVMATVGERIGEAYRLLRAQGINSTFEWNEGNHFKDAEKRTAKAFLWLMNRK